MGRNRSFDESEVVDRAAGQFLATGYEATSLDDLVAATGLHRGSLYKAFGSKRGLFVAALKRAGAHGLTTPDEIDLVLVALLELAPADDEVRSVLRQLLTTMPQEVVPTALGTRLLDRAGLAVPSPSNSRKDTP